MSTNPYVSRAVFIDVVDVVTAQAWRIMRVIEKRDEQSCGTIKLEQTKPAGNPEKPITVLHHFIDPVWLDTVCIADAELIPCVNIIDFVKLVKSLYSADP